MGIREAVCAKVPYLDLIWRGSSIQLHGDLVLRDMLKLLASRAGVTAVVETGTYRGDSTLLFANLFPSVRVYTLDINPIYSNYTKMRLASTPNVRCMLGDSKTLIPKLLTNGVLGSRPLFWLDAHWGNFWPLQLEVAAISSQVDQAIVLIDDFKVPGQPRFDYDLGSGRFDKRPCDIDLIKDDMSTSNDYRILYPNYDDTVALRSDVPNRGTLHGYTAIFQNLTTLFDELRDDEPVRSRFTVAALGSPSPA